MKEWGIVCVFLICVYPGICTRASIVLFIVKRKTVVNPFLCKWHRCRALNEWTIIMRIWWIVLSSRLLTFLLFLGHEHGRRVAWTGLADTDALEKKNESEGVKTLACSLSFRQVIARRIGPDYPRSLALVIDKVPNFLCASVYILKSGKRWQKKEHEKRVIYLHVYLRVALRRRRSGHLINRWMAGQILFDSSLIL